VEENGGLLALIKIKCDSGFVLKLSSLLCDSISKGKNYKRAFKLIEPFESSLEYFPPYESKEKYERRSYLVLQDFSKYLSESICNALLSL
jgi:hypothetical protein